MPAKTSYLGIAAAAFVAILTWKVASSSAYETAKFSVIESEKPFEIREYPDLMLAATKMQSDSKTDRGSFMRLFRYISGENKNEQKIAMTTPVFMESNGSNQKGQMGFVLPKDVASQQAPVPSNDQVTIKKRAGGKFAVVQFNGRMDKDSVTKAQKSLRDWIETKGLTAADRFEAAGYDAPWKPARFRRNEVLIRLLPAKQEAADTEAKN